MIPFVEWTTLRRDGNGMNIDSSSVRRFSRFSVVIVLSVIWWSGRRRNLQVGNEFEHDVDRMHWSIAGDEANHPDGVRYHLF